MFKSINDRLNRTLSALRGSGRLSEQNIRDALRDVRMALLEADVALPVVKAFTDAARDRALGTEVSTSLTPGQAFIKHRPRRAAGRPSAPCAARSQRHAAGGDPAGGPAGRRQDHQRRQARALPERQAHEEPAAHQHRRVSARGPGAIAASGFSQVGVSYFPSESDDPLSIAKGALAEAKARFHDVLIAGYRWPPASWTRS